MNTQQGGEQEREYYIVFDNQSGLNWFYRLFTSKGFRHCFLLTPLGPEHTVVINQTIKQVDISVVANSASVLAKSFYDSGNAVVHLKHKAEGSVPIKTGIMFPTCVQLCQRITGKSYWAFTPKGYFKSLLKDGGCLLSY